MSKHLFFCLLVVCISNTLLAQDNYYFIEFKDKLNNEFSIDQPETFLTQKSIDRRIKQGIPIQEQDLPITNSYKISIANQGVEIYESSKWFNGVIIKGTSQEAEIIKNLDFVTSTTYLAPQNYAGRHSGELDLSDTSDAPSDTLFQNQILNVDDMHSKGYYGKGITIAVLDGGFNNVNKIAPFSHLFANNQLVYSYDFVSKSSDVYQYSSHGTKVLSFMAAQIDGSYQGIAPEANYMLFVTENTPTEYRIEEYYWLIGAEKADSAGVDIISSSLGYNTFDDPSMNYTIEDLDGNTAVVTKAAHIASEKGIVIITSAGNEGNRAWERITFPADMINGLAVGSIQFDYQLSTFSSLGLSTDGRIKPDVVALGSQAYLIDDSGTIKRGSGTSFSAPQVAALIAGVWQAYPNFSSLELLKAIRMSASNVASPDNEFGYGIPSFNAINNFLEAESSNQPVLVYPNPISKNDLVNVKITNPSEIGLVQLEIFEPSGKKLSTNSYSVSWNDNIANIEIQHLSQGLYFLKVLYGSESEEFRIVKL